jgi:hypothetical protein
MMLSNQDRILFIVGLSAVAYPLALGLGYIWVRAMHYPFTLRQRQMWIYYVLFISGVSLLAPMTVAAGLWLLSVKWSFAVALFLLGAWMVIAFYIVRRMSKPGGRLSKERQVKLIP